MINNLKFLLRSDFKKIRKEIPLIRKNKAHLEAFSFLLKTADFYKIILSYASKEEEFCLWPFNTFLEKEKKLYLPKMEKDGLEIYKVTNLKTDLIFNKTFSLLEPDPQKGEKIDPQKIECILVPGLAYDKNNHRIGYGKGCYDKLLKTNLSKDLKTIGIGYLEQLSQKDLPINKHDVSLNEVHLF